MLTQTSTGGTDRYKLCSHINEHVAGRLKAVDEALRHIVIAIPAYNESRFIGSVVLLAREFAKTVIVVDDGSSDDTAYIASAAGARVISHARNLGKGAALNTAFCEVRSLAPDVLVVFDADGQHSPADILQVIRPVLDRKADIVVGSRYLERKCKIPRHRALGHLFINFVAGKLAGVSIRDSQSGYRAFSSKAVSTLSFRSNGFSVEAEMQFLAQVHNLKMAEVPITVRYIDKPKRSVIAHGLAVLSGVIYLSELYRPSLFYSVCGLSGLVTGLLLEATVLDFYDKSSVLALGCALFGKLLVTFGALGLFTAIALQYMHTRFLDLAKRLSADEET